MKRFLSVVLTFAMLLSLVIVPANADASDYSLVAGTVELDGTNDGQVEVKLVTAAGGPFYLLQATWGLSEKNGSNFKLNAMNATSTANDVLVNAFTQDNNVATGAVYYSDSTYNGYYTLNAGDAIWTATYTVDADTPAGKYNIPLDIEVIAGGTTGYDNLSNIKLSAEVVVTRAGEGETVTPYEIYYKLNTDVDADSDKYADLGTFAQGQQVTADIYLKSNDADVTVQAYDIYLTYDSNLTYVSSDLTGSEILDGTGTVLKHIQLVKDENKYITLTKGTEVKLGTVTFNVADDAKYGDPLPITLTVGTNSKTVTNIALANDQKSYYPADASAFDGVEITTTYTVTYADGVDDAVITVPGDQVKEYNKPLTLSAEKPQRDGYTFKEWSGSDGETYAAGATYEGNADLTLTAQWTRNTVTVRWYNATGSEIYNEPVEIGAKAVFGGETPTKAPTAEFTYKFEGWNTDKNAEVALSDLTVTKDTEFYPIFSKTTNVYTVTWQNYDGSELEKDENVPYGTTPEYNGSTPVKEEDKTNTYTFAGWAPAVSAVNGNAIYKATFTAVPKTYTVTFSDEGTTTTATAGYNGTVTLPAAKGKDGYTFDGWYLDGTKVGAAGASYTVTGNVTLTAKYNANSYTVKFDGNGAQSGSVADVNAIYGQSFNMPANGFVRQDWTFDSWNTMADGTGTRYTAGTSYSNLATEGTITLYAIWTQKAYTVSIDTNIQHGSVTADPATANAGDTITLTATPDAGYELNEFVVTGPNGVAVTVDENGQFTMPSGNVTVSATFEAIPYTITVTAPVNGTATAPGNATVGQTVTLTINASNGYKLKSITVMDASNNPVAVEGTTFTMPASAVTVTAEFEGISYTIVFNKNGDHATGTVNSITKVYGTPVSLNGSVYSSTNYEFKHWSTEAVLEEGKTEKTFDKTATISEDLLTPTADGQSVTLYAIWQAKSYNVTLNANGGAIADTDNVTSYEYGKITTLPTPTKEGHDFGGWYTDANFSGEAVTAISNTDSGDKTFYAKWTASTYKVTLNTNDGTIADGKGVENYTYGTAVTLPTAEDMTKNGYTFAGWYENADFTGEKVTEIPANAIGEKTYNAKWELVTYTITFNVNGGEAIADLAYDITSTDKFLPAATKAGYNFAGWSLSETVGNWEVSVYNAGTAITEKYGNVTLEAQWTRAITATVEEYKYANGTGYRLLLVDATGMAAGDVYKFGDETMYYTDDVNYLIDKTNDTGVFYLLIAETNLVKNGNIYTNELTEEAYGKLTVATETRKELDYNGDINGDGVVNIADANAVYQMILAGGSYYSLEQLTLEMRLLADMDKDDTGATAEARASIMDVDAILTVING